MERRNGGPHGVAGTTLISKGEYAGFAKVSLATLSQ